MAQFNNEIKKSINDQLEDFLKKVPDTIPAFRLTVSEDSFLLEVETQIEDND